MITRDRLRFGVALLLVCAHLAHAGQPIRFVQFMRMLGHEPAAIRIKLFVERQPANRLLVLTVDGPAYYRSTQWELEGEAARGLYEVVWQDLPCGSYTVVAQLTRNDRGSSVARESFRVLGFGCPTSDEQP